MSIITEDVKVENNPSLGNAQEFPSESSRQYETHD